MAEPGSLPGHARIVIVGGGVVGCALLHYLASAGCREAVLIEHHELSSGTTWGSSALITHFTSSPFITRLHRETLDLWQALEDRGEQTTGLHRPGSLRLARSAERMREYERYLARAEYLDVAMRLIDRAEIRRLHPLLAVDDLVGAAHTPEDGYVEPASATAALARSARAQGATIIRGCSVRAIAPRPGGAWRLETTKGAITSDVVVNSAGMWAPVLGRMVGTELPVVAMERQYYVTEKVPELAAIGHEVPVLRDPDGTFYMRQETDALLVGPYERRPRFWPVDELPPPGGQQTLPPYLDEAIEPINDALACVPVLRRVGVRASVNVPTSRSPDGNPLVGPIEGLPTMFVAAGFFGGLSEASVCKYLAQWILEGEPDIDLLPFDSRRYGDYATRSYAWTRTLERHVVGLTKEISYPAEELRAGRPAKTSALYDRLAAKGAVFGARFGWEVANWFARGDMRREDQLCFERPNWFASVGAECRGVAAGAGVLDASAFARIDITGAHADRFLARVLASRPPARDGDVAPALMLSAKGRVVLHASLARLAADRFRLVAPPEAERHHLDSLRTQRCVGAAVEIESRTARLGALLLAGPRAREILRRLTGHHSTADDLTVQRATIGAATVDVIPNPTIGVPSWELHCPAEQLLAVYLAVHEAGRELGVLDFGYRALESLRVASRNLAWARELGRDVSPAEAGLDALLSDPAPRPAPARRLAWLAIDADKADAWGAEPLRIAGRTVALVRSAAYDHVGARSLATAFLPSALAIVGTAFEIDLTDGRRGARVIAVAGA